MNTLLRAIVLGSALALSACGFSLRESRPLAPALAEVRIESADPFSSLPQALTRALHGRGAKVNGDGAAVLRILRDEALTEPLTIGEAARVQEYRVTLRVAITVVDAAGKVLLPETTIERRRDYRFDAAQALGASAEDERIREELRREQVYAVLRALEAIR